MGARLASDPDLSLGVVVGQQKKRPKRGAFAAKRGTSKRREIIRAALKVFAEMGYDRATMDDIAQELEATKGLVYGYFKSKEELLAGILSDEELVAQVHAAMTPPAGVPLAQAVESAIDSAFAAMRSNAPLARILYLQSMLPGGLAFRKVLERLYESAALWLEHFKRTGEVRPGVDSRLWGQLAVDGLTNFFLQKQMSGEHGAQPAELKALLEILYHGVTTDRARLGLRCHARIEGHSAQPTGRRLSETSGQAFQNHEPSFRRDG